MHLERSSATMSDGQTVDMTDVYFNVSADDAAAAGVVAICREPTTPTMSRWCSNQLSYAPSSKSVLLNFKEGRIIRCWKIKSSALMLIDDHGLPKSGKGSKRQQT
jgi:hypothetical protein